MHQFKPKERFDSVIFLVVVDVDDVGDRHNRDGWYPHWLYANFVKSTYKIVVELYNGNEKFSVMGSTSAIFCVYGEMNIISVFETEVLGLSPNRRTKFVHCQAQLILQRFLTEPVWRISDSMRL